MVPRKAPQCYVIRALPTLFSCDLPLQISLLLSPSLENLQLQSSSTRVSNLITIDFVVA
jgi:hypothetical protein